MEREIRSPKSIEILNKGFITGFDKVPEAQVIPQAAPNRHVQAYKLTLPEGDLFTKVYFDTPQVADKEYANFHLFGALPFVPKLRFRISPINQEQRLLAYDFIEGGDLHRQLTALRGASIYPDPSLIFQAFQQMHEMDNKVSTVSSGITLPDKAWPIKSPIRREFLSVEEEQSFLRDYQIVHDRNQEAMQTFPGYYFDRNPRNLMKNDGGVMQVDFGVIERSSSLFDIAKFLRNGTDVKLPEGVSLMDAKKRRDLLDRLSILPSGQEEQYLDYVYGLNFPNLSNDTAERNRFKHLYSFAALHAHIFYFTKYGKMLHEGNGDTEKLFSRAFYHFGMAHDALERLEETGEPVSNLSLWLDRFMNIVLN